MKKIAGIICFLIFIFSHSQVGINTTSPTATLDINGNIRIRQAKNLGSANSAKDSILVIDNSGFVNRVNSDMIVSQASSGIIGVTTDATLSGDGKTGNPLKIAQNGAVIGQTLTWSGSAWIPQSNGNSWSLLGNSGTNASTNFLGTTDNQPLIFKTNSTENVRISNVGYVGISTNNPLTSLQVNGGFSLSSTTVNLTADNQVITVGNFSNIKLNSNNATSANRTFTLSNGLVDGQMLMIYPAAGAAQLLDAGNVNIAGNFNFGVEDVLHLVWIGNKWLQVSRSNN
jgi:hypothetical protein